MTEDVLSFWKQGAMVDFLMHIFNVNWIVMGVQCLYIPEDVGVQNNPFQKIGVQCTPKTPNTQPLQ